MASKEVMVTAPIMVLLYDLMFTGMSPRQMFAQRWPLYAVLAASWTVLASLMWFVRLTNVGFAIGLSSWNYALNQCVVITDYLRLSFWPVGLALDYGSPEELSLAQVAPYAVLLAAALTVVVVLMIRWPRAGYPLLWMFVILGPTSSFVPIATEVGAERRMYLPLAGLVSLVVIAAYVLAKRLAPAGQGC